MSNVYKLTLASILGAGVDLDTVTLKAILIDSADYTPNFSTHDNLDDVAAGSRVSSAITLTSVTLTLGVLDAANLTFTSVTGDPCEAILIYVHTGTESTSKLVALITGITVTPDGGNIDVEWDAAGIIDFDG